MYPTKNDLPESVRATSVQLLQARLSDALDLEAQTKQAHWNVRGRCFYQLHLLFDAVHDRVEALVDLLAERITALGAVADGRIQTTAQQSSLPEYPKEGGEMRHVEAIASALASFGRSIRGDIDSAARAGDVGTSDVFTEISRETDQQLWFLEAHLSREN